MDGQIQFETNGLRVLVVPAEETANFFEVKNTSINKPQQLYYRVSKFGMYVTNQRIVILPQGTWKYHCATDAMTEEQKHFNIEYVDSDNITRFKKVAVRPLLRSHGINPNEKHVILIEEK